MNKKINKIIKLLIQIPRLKNNNNNHHYFKNINLKIK